jgi:hypothetical protein
LRILAKLVFDLLKLIFRRKQDLVLEYIALRQQLAVPGKKFVTGKLYINGLEGFWSHAKQRLIKFHGASKEKYALYLKEMEFRYNNRNHDMFELLSQNIVSLCRFFYNYLIESI